MVNKALIRPFLWGGGYVRGGRLTSHKRTLSCFCKILLGQDFSGSASGRYLVAYNP